MKMQDNTSLNSRLPEILFITSYPPRECGIATYSQDLIKALNNKFSNSFAISICPLESENEKHTYSGEIRHTLNIDDANAFTGMTKTINESNDIRIVMIQHEFGLFENRKSEFMEFIRVLTKPVVISFHTVLPAPTDLIKEEVKEISRIASSVIVMTNSSAKILNHDYEIPREKIIVIPHGTHLVPHLDRQMLKKKYDLTDKKVLSTFGLLSSGKSIETTLNALPDIIKMDPDVIFLIIGKTHPSVVKHEGERYRELLEAKVVELKLQRYVRFVNYFLPLPDLLEYLQLTDIYLFTSKDPNQAVSGTFSYAISSGCPIISTPIPHAREILKNDAGIIFDFENPKQLGEAVTSLLKDDVKRKSISSNGLHRMASTAWENAAIAHALLFKRVAGIETLLCYNAPLINLEHLKKMTTSFGMIQFSKFNHPDIESGYTLDDNARALIAMCRHFELTGDESDLPYIDLYLSFIRYCMQPEGNFLNYVDEMYAFTEQNNQTNLEDSNGRAIWALGYLLSLKGLFPARFISTAESLMQSALLHVNRIHSTRAMAFAIKGLYYHNRNNKSIRDKQLMEEFADRLVQMYRHESNDKWQWFESYLTYANSILPEAMLCAWLIIGKPVYREIAQASFAFLLSNIFSDSSIKVIPNKSWLYKGKTSVPVKPGDEQPIDVAYTILALQRFYDVFSDEGYREKIDIAFDWFLGSNHLSQIIYNPCTGGCYDGLEDNYVNLNQGAESTISYLLARLTLNVSSHDRSNRGKETHTHEGYLNTPKRVEDQWPSTLLR